MKRHFVAVPEGATWAEISVTSGHLDGPRVFMVHCAHALRGTRADEVERNIRVARARCPSRPAARTPTHHLAPASDSGPR